MMESITNACFPHLQLTARWYVACGNPFGRSVRMFTPTPTTVAASTSLSEDN